MPLPERVFSTRQPSSMGAALALALSGVACLGAGPAVGAAQVNPNPPPAQGSTMAVAPLYIGPAWGEANPQAHTATLHVRIDNTSVVADRLVRIDCTPIGQGALLNGIVRQVDGVQQNGLDVPGRAYANASTPVQADISLTGLQIRLATGMTASCVLSFINNGERLVVFSIGAAGTPVTEP